METVSCVIIGSGPAGYTAAIYVARANLQPVLIEGPQVGGQLMITPLIENYPGFVDGIEPYTLMTAMRDQAIKYGTILREGMVTHIDFVEGHNIVYLDDDSEICTKSIIIATGASARFLGLPSEQHFMGKGVSGCATCDGFFYRKKTVAVVGGGDTACEEALYLANLCTKVYMIVRKPFLRASEVLQQRIRSNTRIEVLYEHVTQEVLGDEKVTAVRLKHNDEVVELPIDGLFIAIGHHPNTDMVSDVLPLDNEGYIMGDKVTLKGIFVAGDCADPRYKQAIVAAGSGCKAALNAIEYLKNI